LEEKEDKKQIWVWIYGTNKYEYEYVSVPKLLENLNNLYISNIIKYQC
jgi:hypothetical protein